MRLPVIHAVAAVTVAISLVLAPAGPASAAIRIKRIQFDPPGRDTGTNSHLNREYVLLKNIGKRAKSITGWRIFDRGRVNRYVFPEGIRVGAGKTVKLLSGRGGDLESMDGNYILFWGLRRYVWDNDGDRATLKNRAGRTVDRCAYSASASSPKYC